MSGSKLFADQLVAAGFIRPQVLWRGLQLGQPARSRWPVILTITASGLLVEPLAWLQSLLWGHQLQRLAIPPHPVVVIGHWRSGTTYLHQLLSCDPSTATARNSLTIAPQVALLLKPLIRWALSTGMSTKRPIDAVPWGPDDPQEDEVGLARLTIDTNMAGVAFPQAYPFHFRRSVLSSSRHFERKWLWFNRLTWLHDGPGKTQLLIKNSAHTARVALVLKHYPQARFILLKREPIACIRSLVQVKQRLAELVGLQPVPAITTQVEETVAAHRELLQAFEAARALIPPGQLLELNYNDLVEEPLNAVHRIYEHFALTSWEEAEPAIRKRIAQASSYRADLVLLPPAAEQRLQELLKAH